MQHLEDNQLRLGAGACRGVHDVHALAIDGVGPGVGTVLLRAVVSVDLVTSFGHGSEQEHQSSRGVTEIKEGALT